MLKSLIKSWIDCHELQMPNHVNQEQLSIILNNQNYENLNIKDNEFKRLSNEIINKTINLLHEKGFEVSATTKYYFAQRTKTQFNYHQLKNHLLPVLKTIPNCDREIVDLVSQKLADDLASNVYGSRHIRPHSFYFS
jgi:hypothetical protein